MAQVDTTRTSRIWEMSVEHSESLDWHDTTQRGCDYTERLQRAAHACERMAQDWVKDRGVSRTTPRAHVAGKNSCSQQPGTK